MLASKLCAALLGSRQRILGALADYPSLFIGNHGHDPHSQPVGVRNIGTNEVNTGVFQAQQK